MYPAAGSPFAKDSAHCKSLPSLQSGFNGPSADCRFCLDGQWQPNQKILALVPAMYLMICTPSAGSVPVATGSTVWTTLSSCPSCVFEALRTPCRQHFDGQHNLHRSDAQRQKGAPHAAQQRPSARPPLRQQAGVKRQRASPEELEEDEEEEDDDAFIDDDGAQDWRTMLRSMTGYNPSR